MGRMIHLLPTFLLNLWMIWICQLWLRMMTAIILSCALKMAGRIRLLLGHAKWTLHQSIMFQDKVIANA